jgi:hypothetical protein
VCVCVCVCVLTISRVYIFLLRIIITTWNRVAVGDAGGGAVRALGRRRDRRR